LQIQGVGSFAQRYHVDQPRTQIKRKGNSGGDLNRTARPSLRQWEVVGAGSARPACACARPTALRKCVRKKKCSKKFRVAASTQKIDKRGVEPGGNKHPSLSSLSLLVREIAPLATPLLRDRRDAGTEKCRKRAAGGAIGNAEMEGGLREPEGHVCSVSARREGLRHPTGDRHGGGGRS
jgi:hypothetical protein